MRHAKHSSGIAVILKLLRSQGNELSILQYLCLIKSPHNHTIPLLSTFNLDVGTFIVVPEFTPLDLGLRLGQFRGKIADLGCQLIEGVAFIHRHGVAHLDIKPQNIVVSHEGRLYIIDFDISLRVDGPDYLIDNWRGTPLWMAPEIGDRDEPRRLYSPIRADLWSCGRVLWYLSGNSNEDVDSLKTLARQLLNPNPRLRPLLHLSTPGVEIDGRLKRNADIHVGPRSHRTKRLAC